MKTFYTDIFDVRIPPAPPTPRGRGGNPWSLEGGGGRVRLTPCELKRVLTR